ncbi:hypothetical protein Sste5346_002710 [Sporothrix stenoceras]|uniref:F-box domain-containing protein n=1 Tax=Sporothrix stenoceras TaxID=5173 RepID=A0ABR3ZHG3_9PEZI
MANHQAALDRLPDDILFLITENLDTARDQASLGGTCRKLHGFMQSDGWRTFTRRCFPSVFSADLQGQSSVNCFNGTAASGGNSDDGEPGWSTLAETLTWQSRAWNRKALAFQALMPKQDHIPRHKRPRPFMPSLAVHFQADLAESGKRLGLGIDGEELLVIGAGEDIVARFRKRGRQAEAEAKANGGVPLEPVMHILNGQTAGFRAGFDDVRALSVVKNAMGMPHRRGILSGRDSGGIDLISAEPDETFGRLLAKFVPKSDTGVDQSRLSSIDVTTNSRHAAAFGGSFHGCGLAAVTTPSDIVFYPMPGPENTTDNVVGKAGEVPKIVHHAAAFPLDDVGLYHNGIRQPFNARWMEAEGTLAVAMGAGPKPLRYLTTTPTGPIELTSAYTLPDLMEHYSLKDTTLVIPTSLTPVSSSSITGGNGHLTLSGWRDGTCRLQDLRTASPFDMIYQDNVLGSQDSAQAIMIWDTERFITGNQASPGLKIFDLRWPRRYFHTDALPCSHHFPYPMPPEPTGAPDAVDFSNLSLAEGMAPEVKSGWLPHLFPPEQRNARNWPPRTSAMPVALPSVQRCDVLQSVRCRWHIASRDLFYRSSASLFLQHSLEDHDIKATGVFALARASGDLAPSNFYAGLSNCVVESYLHEQVVGFETPRRDPRSGPSGNVLKPIRVDGGNAPHFGYQQPASGTITVPVKHRGVENNSSETKTKTKTRTKTNNNTKTDRNRTAYQTWDLDVAFMETGDSIAHPNIEQRPMWLPRFRNRRPDFVTVAQSLFSESTNEDVRDCDKMERNPAPSNGISFLERCQHRLDFGLQDNFDFPA